MVDYFSLALTHGLIALALLRLVLRAELDRDPEPVAEAQDEPGEEEPAPKSAVPRLKLPVRRA
jgi:hypothetical protein